MEGLICEKFFAKLFYKKACRSGGMVDAHASGACGATRAGSSPVFGSFFFWKKRNQKNLSHIDFITNAKQIYVKSFW